MTDFELNKAIAEARGYKSNGQGILIKNNITTKAGNFCNNWNDLMPLVIEYKMRLTPQPNHEYQAAKYAKDVFIEKVSTSAQRALAECLLKVLQGVVTQNSRKDNAEND